MKTQLRSRADLLVAVKQPVATQKKFYEDQYAKVSFVESIPCIKVTLSGVPRSSEHYQFINQKLVEFISGEIANYCRLHLLTDSSQAGLILEEDIEYYKREVVPALEKAGIRYHAIVLPEAFIARLFMNQISFSTRKLKVEYFNTTSGACKWLRNR